MMTKARASVFDDENDFDVSSFSPKAAPDPAAPSVDQVRAIAEASNFPSRAAKKIHAPAPAETRKREPRRHRTSRTAQFNARTTPETVDAFYAIADRQGWLVGETIEHALAALQRELAGQGRA
jgi:hypothetical protein